MYYFNTLVINNIAIVQALSPREVVESSSDCLSLISTFQSRVQMLESSVLVLKPAHGFDDSLAIVFGNFDLKNFLIYREEPRQFTVLVSVVYFCEDSAVYFCEGLLVNHFPV
jgi:hypothetical protein